MSRHAVPALLLTLLVLSVAMGHLDSDDGPQYCQNGDVTMGDSLGIGLTADNPTRDRIIAGLAVIALIGSILAAMYYIANKEGL